VKNHADFILNKRKIKLEFNVNADARTFLDKKQMEL
jgi:hypothetical protein